MASVLGGLVGTSVALALTVRHLLFVSGPSWVIPGTPEDDSSLPCLYCGMSAPPVDHSDLFACSDCDIEFAVAACGVCSYLAWTVDWDQWNCGKPGHTTDSTRRCPCGRLGEEGEDGYWHCRNRCARFTFAECWCGDGYQTSHDGVNWYCELGFVRRGR